MTRTDIIKELGVEDKEEVTTEELANDLQYSLCQNCVEYPEMYIGHCGKCVNLIETEE